METRKQKIRVLASVAALSLSVLIAPAISVAGVGNFVPLVVAQAAPSTLTADRAALLNGVEEIRAPGGLVATLTLLSNNAFTVVTGSQSRDRVPVVAAARAGKGRVVVYGHGNFIGASGLSDTGTARLLTNAVKWTAGGKSTVRVGILDWAEATPALKAAGFTVVPLTASSLTPAGLAGIDVLVSDNGTYSRENGKGRITAIQNWVRGGGGLITMGVGWGWQQLNPDKNLASDSGFNPLLVSLADIGVDSGTADPTGPSGAFLVDGQGMDTPTADFAIRKLEAFATGKGTLAADEIRPLTRTLLKASDVLPDTDTRYLPRLKGLIAKAGPVTPTKYSPVTLNQPLERLAAVFQSREMARTPVDQVKAHPSAAAFPGAVPAEAPRIASRTLNIDTSVPEWHSTGLYAAPGEAITVTFPASAVGKKFGVRIGAQKDSLWNLDTWPRYPEITLEKKITAPTMKIANAFGGTIYVVVPDNTKMGTIPVTISGAVAQPYYVKGKTTAAEWEALKNAPAPWAEIQGDRIIITVPSYAVRNLRDPEGVAKYWDDVADAAADLYSIPHERERQERYCVDIEISAGYMHSGYPIMTHDDVDRSFVNLNLLRGSDGNKTWGFYHELGHNHQRPEWTWSGLGEVTNNLFSLYGDETFNKTDSNYSDSHGAIAPTTRRDRLTKYLANGVSFEGMNSDPFLTLTFFIDLRREFGWEPFKKVFGEYRGLSNAERPKTELEKHDQFLTRFSRAVGKDLGPYFTAWGLPTSESARKAVSTLPRWMPKDWPTSAEIAAARQGAKTSASAALGTPKR
jgi:hypothetical protein